MQYKKKTDCAIKALCFLAERKEKGSNLFGLAKCIGVSSTSTQGIMRTLRMNTNWIKSMPGLEGGYYFIGDAENITIHDIHKAMEDEITMDNGVLEKGIMIDAVYEEFISNTKDYFSLITLQHLLDWKTYKEVDAYMIRTATIYDEGKLSDIFALKREMDNMKSKYEAKIVDLSKERDKIEAEYEDMCRRIDGLRAVL